MKKIVEKIIVVFLVAAVVGGCGKDEPSSTANSAANTATNKVEKAKKPKKARPLPVIDGLAPTSVVVRVNGHDITKADFSAWENLRMQIWAINKGFPMNVNNDESRKVRASNRMRVLGELVKGEMIRQHAQKEGITADEARVRAVEKKFLKEIRGRNSKANFETALTKFPKESVDVLRRAIQIEAITDVVLDKSTTNDLHHVTEAEVTNRIDFVKKWNKEADEKNAANREKAKKAKEEILKGAYFVDVAKKYADFSPEQGDTWESVSLDELDSEDPLLHWLVRAEVGDISDPIEMDDGISIVGLKMKHEMENPEPGEPNIWDYELVRCAFYAYEKLDEIEDHDELVEDMLSARRRFAMEELRKKLVEKAVIEFPSGQNLFYAVTKPKKPGRPKKQPTKVRKPVAEKPASDDGKSIKNSSNSKSETVSRISNNSTIEKSAGTAGGSETQKKPAEQANPVAVEALEGKTK